MQPRKYVVVPQMEGGLENLRKLAANLWFSWNVEAVELFDYLDEQLWKETNHNPLQTLIRLSRQRLNEIQHDEGFLAHTERVYRYFKSYMNPAGVYEYRIRASYRFHYGLFFSGIRPNGESPVVFGRIRSARRGSPKIC